MAGYITFVPYRYLRYALTFRTPTNKVCTVVHKRNRYAPHARVLCVVPPWLQAPICTVCAASPFDHCPDREWPRQYWDLIRNATSSSRPRFNFKASSRILYDSLDMLLSDVPGVDTHEWTVASVGALLFGPAYLPSYLLYLPSFTHITRLRNACYVRSRGLGPVSTVVSTAQTWSFVYRASHYRSTVHNPIYRRRHYAMIDTIVDRTCMIKETIPAYRGRMKL